MGLNKQKGDMYPWVTHTWNPVRGECPHNCFYCYVPRRFPVGDLRFTDKEMATNLHRKEPLTIFIGSSTDMFADCVPGAWIAMVIEKCKEASQNTYLFQTKNPERFLEFTYPPDTILGTTIESDIAFPISSAPAPMARAEALLKVKTELNLPIMVSVEPVMAFFPYEFDHLLCTLDPGFVSIGADSGHNDLPEPNSKQLANLFEGLRDSSIEVRIKPNLKRLL